MVICVKCCDTITKKKTKEEGWKRINGRWHCGKCAGVREVKKDKNL